MPAGEAMSLRLAAVILAAGAGERMGGPKALTLLRGVPLLVRAVRMVQKAGVPEVIAVLGARADEAAELLRESNASIVTNDHWDHGQSSSVRAGVSAVSETARGFLIHPVDHALVREDDVRLVVDAWTRTPNPERAILRPVFENTSFGHPVLFGRDFRMEFLALSENQPANTVYRAHRHDVVLVPVKNPYIARDLDTPDDLAFAERHFG